MRSHRNSRSSRALAFFAVAWLVMKFGWPHIMAAIEERQKKIAEGLAAAERGEKSLAEAKNIGQRHHQGSARARRQDRRAGQSPFERAGRGGARHRDRRRPAPDRRMRARKSQLESIACARTAAQGSRGAGRERREQAARSRDRCQGACRSARQAGARDRARLSATEQSWPRKPPSPDPTPRLRSSSRDSTRRSRAGRRCWRRLRRCVQRRARRAAAARVRASRRTQLVGADRRDLRRRARRARPQLPRARWRSNRRLALLPEIAAMFETLRAEVENIADVQVTSAVQLDEAQRSAWPRH